MGKKSCVSDDNEEDEVRAKMLTWLFHISEGEKKGSDFYQGVDVMSTDSVVTEY